MLKSHLTKAALAGAASLMFAGGANAAITVSQSAYYNYASDVSAFSSANVVCDFDSACAPGYSVAFAGGSGSGAGIYTGSQSGITAAPPGDRTAYASLLGPDGTMTLTSSRTLQNVSFFMGSPDSYNGVSFYDADGDLLGGFAGSAFTGPPANGDQSLGERITFNFNGAPVSKVVFSSTQNSFEFDRVGAVAAGVPEPGAWALMLVGFGALGAALRRSRSATVSAAAAAA
jgi:hypothetical protein